MPHRILIADDEPHIAELVRICLEESDVQVLEARDGETALAIARRDQPSIALLDVMMPRVDGFEVCRRLKGDPRTQGIVVLMLTAGTRPADRERGVVVGAQGYLTKPFSPVQLAGILGEHLRSLPPPESP